MPSTVSRREVRRSGRDGRGRSYEDYVSEAVSYRGAVYCQTTSPKWAALNSLAVLFEFEVDSEGNTSGEFFEWK